MKLRRWRTTRRRIDRLQVWLHQLSLHRLARLVGKWGTREWTADGPLRLLEFDPLFNKQHGIDAGRDIALPHTKHDVN